MAEGNDPSSPDSRPTSCEGLRARLYFDIHSTSSDMTPDRSVMNQRPPRSLDQLTRTAWKKVVSRLSKDVVNHLDRFLEQE